MQVYKINTGATWSDAIELPRNAYYVRIVQFARTDAARVIMMIDNEEVDLSIGGAFPLISPKQIRAEDGYEPNLANKYRPNSIRIRLDLPTTRPERARVCLAFIERPDRRDDIEPPGRWAHTQEWALPSLVAPAIRPADYSTKTLGIIPCRGFRSGTWTLECSDLAYMVSVVGLGKDADGEGVVYFHAVMPLLAVPQAGPNGVGGANHPPANPRRHRVEPFEIPPGVQYLRFRAWRHEGAVTVPASTVVLSTRDLTAAEQQSETSTGFYLTAASYPLIACVRNITGRGFLNRCQVHCDVGGPLTIYLFPYNNLGIADGADHHSNTNVGRAALVTAAAISLLNGVGPLVTSDCIGAVASWNPDSVPCEGRLSMRYIETAT